MMRFADALDKLKAEAVRRTGGLHDFSDEAEYLPGLRKLLEAIDVDLDLPPSGEHLAFSLLLGPLISRLYANEGWKQRPDCLTRPIKAPVIIVGLVRTGTTALHRLLSCDPQFQGPELWLMDTPMPRPPRATWDDYAQYRECVAMMKAISEASPMWNVVHPRGADLVDEILDITKQCYTNNVWGSYFPLPTYDAWWPHQDHGPQYRYLHRLLQLIGADDTRPWLLKDPSSIMCMPLLFETFPDAKLIYTHRDPLEVLPSVTAVVVGAQALSLGDRVDARSTAERSAQVWSDGANQLASAAVASWPHMDVYLRDFQTDRMRTVREIYERFGFTLSKQAEAAMLARIAEDSAEKPGPKFTLEEFGLDAKRVREQFAPYIERFGPFDRKRA